MILAEITAARLAWAYLLMLIPLGIMLWYRIPMVGRTVVATIRMTVQLLFVGFYLQVVFDYNNPWLNTAWLFVMIGVADVSIIRNCDLRLRRFVGPLLAALLVGTAVPLLFFLGPVLRIPGLLDARYAIPIGGMILGNCLRSNVIGINTFYQSIRTGRRAYLHALAQGAGLHEATRPYLAQAFRSALAPTVATMSTIGLVSLPGMMTGVILGGSDPMEAIEYQIAIMIAILSGTALTVLLAIWLTIRGAFTPWGLLDTTIFADRK